MINFHSRKTQRIIAGVIVLFFDSCYGNSYAAWRVGLLFKSNTNCNKKQLGKC